ncbi:unnamed protein product [Schistosoma turkestanicum]|nr:unnamed protein product [Schistosoma turkestanicum]
MGSEDFVNENKLLKLKVLELSEQLQRNIIYFNERLGATEYELEQCKKTNEDLLSQKNANIRTLQQENETLQNQITALHIDLNKQKQIVQLKQEKIDQMEVYLSKLPTLEDYQETLNKLQLVSNQNSLLEKNIEQYKMKLNQCDTQLTHSTIEIEQLKQREQSLQTQLNTIMERLNENKTGQFNTMNKSKLTPIFVEDLKCELERYRSAFEKTKKLLEAETCRAETAETHQKLEQRKADELRTRLEAEMTGIQASLSARRDEIRELKKHISEITLEKQELLSTHFEAYHTLRNLISLWKSINGGQLCQRIYEFIRENVNELVCLVQHLNHLANGQKLNLNELLVQPKPLANSLNDILLLNHDDIEIKDDDDDGEVVVDGGTLGNDTRTQSTCCPDNNKKDVTGVFLFSTESL